MRLLQPSAHPIWATHVSRPANSTRRSCHNLQFLSSRPLSLYKRKEAEHFKRRALLRLKRNPIFPYEPPFQRTTEPGHNTRERRDRRSAELARWNGRRSLFLGTKKNRRDAAFAQQDHNTVNAEDLRNSIIDGLFKRELEGFVKYPCVQKSEYTRRQFGIGEKFGIDHDLSGVNITEMLSDANLGGLIFAGSYKAISRKGV
jgi:hypothetical protein